MKPSLLGIFPFVWLRLMSDWFVHVLDSSTSVVLKPFRCDAYGKFAGLAKHQK